MKVHTFFAINLSFTLMACQMSNQLSSSNLPKQSEKQMAQPVGAKVGLNRMDTTASVTQLANQEKLTIQMHFPERFETHLADRSQLRYVKVTLKGQGLNKVFTHDGQAFLPVIGNTIKATVSGIPIDNQQLRVVTLQGYDADYKALGAFEARGYYRSQTGVKNISITINRASILLGRIIESTLSNSTLLNALDLTALQGILEAAMVYQSGDFELDPSEFDTQLILSLIPPTGSPLPTAEVIRQQALKQHEDVEFAIMTPNGAKINENVRFVLNDPNSDPKMLPRLSASGSRVVFFNIVAGDWTLSAYGEAGNLLAQTDVSINNIATTIAENPLMLTSVKEVEEFRINTYTLNGQLHPDVAIDPLGNFIVVWESDLQDGDGNEVYAQRYRSDGETLGSEFRVNSYTFNNQFQPKVAIDDDGDFVVTWTSNGQSPANLDIYARRFDSLGSALGSEFRVNTGTGNSQENQAIAMDANGDFTIVWDSYTEDGSSGGIFAQRYDALGTAQGSQFRVNTQTSASQSSPDIAMDDTGNFIVTWMSFNQDGDSWGIFAQRYNIVGAVQGSEFLVNNLTTSGQYAPSVACDADGDFVITWQGPSQIEYTDIYFQRYNSQGLTQGSEFGLNLSSHGLDNSDISMDDVGNFVLSWDGDSMRDNQDVFAQRFDNSGNLIDSEFRVNLYTSNGQSRPALAMNGHGDFVISWHSWEQDGDALGVFGQMYKGPMISTL